MPMTKIKNYLQSPALYQYIDMDLTLRTINKNIMEDKGDNIFGVNCNDPILLRSEKNLAVRKKKVNYNQYWIVHLHPDKDDNNIDLLNELNNFFDSIFDTFEENDRKELKKCMQYSNVFLVYNIIAGSKKKIYGCIIYNIEEYGSFISFIGIDAIFGIMVLVLFC